MKDNYYEIDGVKHRLGFFNTQEDTYAVHCSKAGELHGDFANV